MDQVGNGLECNSLVLYGTHNSGLRSPRIYERLRAAVGDSKLRCHVFGRARHARYRCIYYGVSESPSLKIEPTLPSSLPLRSLASFNDTDHAAPAPRPVSWRCRSRPLLPLEW
jgi:hypothetical protein